jgi:cytochrome P450
VQGSAADLPRDPYPLFAAKRAEHFDIFRTRIPHISFPAGEHTCMGLHLARLETRVALECLLDRLDGIESITDDDPHIHGQPFRSPTALPVRFRLA